MWPSVLYCDLIMKRLNKMAFPFFREHLSYDNVGHMILSPSVPIVTKAVLHPVTQCEMEVGGQAEAQAAACRDSWAKILDFYKKFGR